MAEQRDNTVLSEPFQICTRLPASDANFQTGQFVLGSFLSEAMTEPSPRIWSPFNECVILVTICGRSLLHGQKSHVLSVYQDEFPAWSDQHRWLDNILANRLEILSQHYHATASMCDIMPLFANIIGQVSVIYLCKGVETVSWTCEESRVLALKYRQRALAATEQVVNFAKALSDFHLFKACFCGF